MREIFFRGQKIDTKEWVYGDLSRLQTPRKTAFFINQIEVIPETVGQYTGLKDKNGVRIFEGDVIEVCNSCGYGFLSSGSIATIKWSDTETCYFIDGKFRLTKNKKIEVIGNIHDKHVL